MSLSVKEEVSIVDEQNEEIGKADRCVMRKYALPHRATYIVAKRSSGKYLVQQRTMIKDYCPGMLDPMSGGVVQYQESYEENAYREIFEEMGIEDTKLHFVKTFYHEDEKSKVWGGMFECIYDGELTLQKEEVDNVFEMTAEEIFQRQKEFTPDGIVAFKQYLDFKKQNE